MSPRNLRTTPLNLNRTTMPHPAPTMVTAAATSWTSFSSSSRWCPTPEQLMILEEMYRMGIHTPSASQIQQITAHLSSYGKIEGKNVFYWFQNHKARDRQRHRRKLSKQVQLGHHPHHHNHQLCFQLPPNPQQHQHQHQHQHQIFNHQQRSINNCFTQYVHEQLPSHSPGSADSQRSTCCSPNSFLQVNLPPNHFVMHDHVNYFVRPADIPTNRGRTRNKGGKVGSKRLMRGTSSDDRVKASNTGAMRIRGLLDCMLTVDASRSCFQYLPQPLKTLDLFPTTATNLGEECTPQQSIQDHNF